MTSKWRIQRRTNFEEIPPILLGLPSKNHRNCFSSSAPSVVHMLLFRSITYMSLTYFFILETCSIRRAQSSLCSRHHRNWMRTWRPSCGSHSRTRRSSRHHHRICTCHRRYRCWHPSHSKSQSPAHTLGIRREPEENRSEAQGYCSEKMYVPVYLTFVKI